MSASASKHKTPTPGSQARASEDPMTAAATGPPIDAGGVIEGDETARTGSEDLIENAPVDNGQKNILSLPNEMILEILSYLNYGDRLVGRKVCSRWNRVISNSTKFLNSTRYLIPKDSTASFTVFKASTVLWRNMELETFSDAILESRIWRRPQENEAPNFRLEAITEIQLRDQSLMLCLLQKFLNQFPRLKRLGIIHCQLELSTPEEWVESEDQITKFRELKQRLESLRIFVKHVKDANLWMAQFMSYVSALQILHIEIDCGHYPPHEHDPEFSKFPSNLYEVMQCCITTLSQLLLELPRVFLGPVRTVLLRFDSPLNQDLPALNLNRFALRWSSEYDAQYKLQFPFPNLQIADILNFLMPQTKLKSIFVQPIYFRNTETTTALLQILDSRDFKCFGSKGNVLKRTVLQKLRNTVELDLIFVKTQRLIAAVNSDVYPKLKSLRISGLKGRGCAKIIAQTFPNLTKLVIKGHEFSSAISTRIRDADLQMIIRNLSNLTNLILRDCAEISDFGLAGIKHSWRLKGVEELSLRCGLSEIGIPRDGLPLSSLTYLSYLELGTTSSFISDVGIHYGLNFEDLRGLCIDLGEQMTDWGLKELGALNPCLETVKVSTKSEVISQDAINVLMNSLPRITERNFRVEIVPPAADVFNTSESENSGPEY